MCNPNRFSVLIIVSILTILFVSDVDTTEPIVDGSNGVSSFRDSLESGGEGPEMVVISSGTFQMGCLKDDDCRDEELPVREVRVTKFALSKYEVTFAEYDKFAKATERRLPNDFGWGRDDQPVINVSWNDAKAYVDWLSQETGKNYRLPNEAEWEYAARAGSKSTFSFGNDVAKLCEYSNHADSSTEYRWSNESCSDGVASQPATIGSFIANSWGLHDMHGNVWEWVEDCWHQDYTKAPTDGSAHTSDDCTDRVIRSGSFQSDTRMVSSSFRLNTLADYPGHIYGFRVAKTLDETPSVDAAETDLANTFTIVGEIKTSQDSSIANSENDIAESDWAQALVTVTHELTNTEGDDIVVELASGSFVDGHVSLVGEIDEPTLVQISTKNNKNKDTTVSATITPGGETVSFVLVQLKDSPVAQLHLIGTSRQSTNSENRFEIAGTYESEENHDDEVLLKASLFTAIENEVGEPRRSVLGTVLLDDGRFLFEAEVDEPRVAKLEIFKGRDLVWDTLMVVEPQVEITISRHGPDNVLYEPSANAGSQVRLLDSWRLSEEFLSLHHKSYIAGKKLLEELGPGKPLSAEVMTLWQELETKKAKELKRLALDSEDPFDSLLALELAAQYYLIPRILDANEVVAIYDKLSTSLNEDVVARRVTPTRNRLAADAARVANFERLVVGEEVPDFALPDLDGEMHSLKEIIDANELVFIDFWASWCGPCIAAFPALKELYTNYSDKGFEIVSISVDMIQQDWVESSDEQELPWIDLGEIRNMYGATAVAYGVSALPTTYLIDNNKQIIRKSLKSSDLKNVLLERLGESNSKD
ncbi:MAG: SUMF1/EgtB/PvdO family nonheme iron enzyme [Gammaproteobacteria bacterium]|nr:SUMF1/EgtB/PvdO family nonheme iron enzyme [Gammaproteobacteria bacterium]MYF38032.1 SUMF1/EgtB/PvdO family nonheme iron enzyme [Gammaproteobacteria bacterium]